MRRFRIPALLASFVLLAACSGGGEEEEAPYVGTEGLGAADRYVRLFELQDFGSSLFVYDDEVPPVLVQLLNPEMTDETLDEDLVTLPVHPDGVLLGSYHVRRRDGTNEIWLMFDVPAPAAEVEATILEQVNETPWQVTGGQSSEIFAAVLFSSTVSGDVEGFATIQALPSSPTFVVTVERAGEQLELELPRGAVYPELDLRYRGLTEGLEVTDVLSDSMFEEGDLIVAVGDAAVGSEEDLSKALRGLGETGTPRTGVIYQLAFVSPSPVDEPVFMMPPGRPLPESFPAGFLVGDDLTPVDVSWAKRPEGEVYQVTLLTSRSAFEVAEEYRELLVQEGWELTDDQAQGFGTILSFESLDLGYAGVANIDQFPSDESRNAVTLQIQRTN